MTSPSPIDLLKVPTDQAFPTKQAMVTHVLRTAIMHDELEPGERLIIDDIAYTLKVSTIPVREALHLLMSERLVEHRPHAGAVVAAITPEATRETFALLEALECCVAEAAVALVTDSDLAGLRALLSQFAQITSDRAWSELNQRFHRRFAEIAKMPRALEMLDQVTTGWDRIRRHRYHNSVPPDAAIADTEHRELVEALAARDLPRLLNLVRQHNRSALAHYVHGEQRPTL